MYPKEVPPEPVAVKEEEEQMFAEVNILKQLDHPNIVGLVDVGSADDLPYLVMEYVGGSDLSTLVNSTGAIGYINADDGVNTYSDTMTWAKGKHVLKFGGEYRTYCTEHGIEVVTMSTVDEVGEDTGRRDHGDTVRVGGRRPGAAGGHEQGGRVGLSDLHPG